MKSTFTTLSQSLLLILTLGTTSVLSQSQNEASVSSTTMPEMKATSISKVNGFQIGVRV